MEESFATIRDQVLQYEKWNIIDVLSQVDLAWLWPVLVIIDIHDTPIIMYIGMYKSMLEPICWIYFKIYT
jgi:hypothetical protein